MPHTLCDQNAPYAASRFTAPITGGSFSRIGEITMRTPLIAAALACFILPQTPAQAEEIFKIQIGKDYSGYTDKELKHRVWELERAVYQLQARVFQLEAAPAAPAESWVCTISAMGDTYTGTGASQAQTQLSAG